MRLSGLREAPSLGTSRLSLRAHALDDLPDCAAMWGDAEVTRFIGGRPATPEEVWARVLRYAGLWAHLGIGYWVVRERDTGRFVGEVGLADFRRDIVPSLDGAPEVGWALATWARGGGYATEMVQAAVAWSDANLPAIERTVCMITPENAASIKVAERCGFRPLGPAIYGGHATTVFERPRATTHRMNKN